jgi:hypothetical protein
MAKTGDNCIVGREHDIRIENLEKETGEIKTEMKNINKQMEEINRKILIGLIIMIILVATQLPGGYAFLLKFIAP